MTLWKEYGINFAIFLNVSISHRKHFKEMQQNLNTECYYIVIFRYEWGKKVYTKSAIKKSEMKRFKFEGLTENSEAFKDKMMKYYDVESAIPKTESEFTADLVKLYLRDMGGVMMLTRDGEISLARRVEKGQKSVVRALINSRLMVIKIRDIRDRIEDDDDYFQRSFNILDIAGDSGKIARRKAGIITKIEKIIEAEKELIAMKKKTSSIFDRGRLAVRLIKMIQGL